MMMNQGYVLVKRGERKQMMRIDFTMMTISFLKHCWSVPVPRHMRGNVFTIWESFHFGFTI